MKNIIKESFIYLSLDVNRDKGVTEIDLKPMIYEIFHSMFYCVQVLLLTQIKETRRIFGNFIELKHRK